MNQPLITELLNVPANAEKIRDQIAAILSLELQNQYQLAVGNNTENSADYDIEIFVENSRPYDTTADELISRVNIVLQDISVPKSNPRIGKQATHAKFEIYCIANGNTTGDFHDDKTASFRAWKIMRLVWGILMAEAYTYLGMRGIVAHRAFTKMEAGTPNEQSAQAVTVIRASLEVHLSEGYIAGPSVPFEGYNFEITEDGQVIAEFPSLRDQVNGVTKNNPQEEDN